MRFSLTIILFTFGCADAGLQSSSTQTPTGERQIPYSADTQIPAPPPAPAPSADAEAAVPPNNINGAFLRCTFTARPSDQSPEAQIGCRLDDSDGNRVKTSALAQAATYSYTAGSGVSVNQISLKNDPTYDALYDFKGSNADQTLKGVLNTRISIRFQGLITGEAQATISGLVRDVQGTAQASGLSGWKRDAASDTNSNGRCDNQEECIYQDPQGLFWAKSIGKASWFNADTACQKKGWRLPSSQELIQPNIAAFKSDFVIDERDQYWASTGNDTDAYVASWNSATTRFSVSLLANKGTEAFFICVR